MWPNCPHLGSAFILDGPSPFRTAFDPDPSLHLSTLPALFPAVRQFSANYHICDTSSPAYSTQNIIITNLPSLFHCLWLPLIHQNLVPRLISSFFMKSQTVHFLIYIVSLWIDSPGHSVPLVHDPCLRTLPFPIRISTRRKVHISLGYLYAIMILSKPVT